MVTGFRKTKERRPKKGVIISVFKNGKWQTTVYSKGKKVRNDKLLYE